MMRKRFFSAKSDEGSVSVPKWHPGVSRVAHHGNREPFGQSSEASTKGATLGNTQVGSSCHPHPPQTCPLLKRRRHVITPWQKLGITPTLTSTMTTEGLSLHVLCGR
eukprot:1705088-Amphidinium_carterae.1